MSAPDKQPAAPRAENARLSELKDYEILDTEFEAAFDNLVKLASQICEAPVSLISLVDEHRQWFKAETGLGQRETSLDVSICKYAIEQDHIFEVPDASQDARFNTNPLVAGDPNFRFYSGAVLQTPKGFKLGTLCVLDYQPRELTAAQRFALQTLADQVMMQLEMRRALIERQREQAETERWRRVYETVLTNTPDFIYVIGLDKRFIYANDALLTMWGKTQPDVFGRNFYEIGYEPWHAALHEREIDEVIQTRQPIRNTVPFTGTTGRRIYDYIFAPVFDETGQITAIAGTTRDITERKEAAERLQKSEEDFRFAQECGGIGIFSVDLETDLLTVTPEFCRLFGLPESATVSPRDVENLFHADDLSLRSTVETRLAGTAPLSVEYRIYRQNDRQLRWLSRSGRFVYNDAGQAIQMVGIIQDITERKLAESILKEKEDQFRTMAQAMPNQVWTALPNGELDWFNQKIFDYTGLAHEQLANGKWSDIIHPHDLAAAMETWTHSIDTGAHYETQFRIRRADGVYRWHIIRALPIKTKDGLVRWIGTNTDIEDQQIATEEANAARSNLSLILESAKGYAIISLDVDGKVVLWNNEAQRIFGYEADEIIGQSVGMIFTPEDQAYNVPAHELNTAAQEGRANDERWHLRKNGERFYVSGTMASMRDNYGQINGYVKIARDMTDERRAQETLVEARNAAEAANIAKTEFLANMSHEIRTPMNAVIGLSNILAISQPLTPKQKDFIKTLQMSADSLLSLINDLLDIAKIEARTVDLENVPFSLTQLMQEVISMMGVRVREKGLRFTGDGECVERRMFMGDPTRLRQIILNLCSNAVKFTEHGGIHIVITCEKLPATTVENICIAVQDTGIGIASDKLETIFHKFTQADSSINRKYGGTGLGLAITKTLVEIMGGALSVESLVGQGSTFKVTIPLKAATAADVQAAGLSLVETFNQSVSVSLNQRILLVEDYAPNVLVARTFLESFGYVCDVAQNGVEAIDKVKHNLYAACLMDVQMHGMNGLEATQLIRELERQHGKPRLPIIGMTAHALMGDRERCLGVGMDDYIAKPFNPTELRDKLDLIIRGSVRDSSVETKRAI